jgi:hypothetical protein
LTPRIPKAVSVPAPAGATAAVAVLESAEGRELGVMGTQISCGAAVRLATCDNWLAFVREAF